MVVVGVEQNRVETGPASSRDVHRDRVADKGDPVPFDIVARRPGDIGACYADPALAKQLLGWQGLRDLDTMCADSWRWQSMNPNGCAAP